VVVSFFDEELHGFAGRLQRRSEVTRLALAWPLDTGRWRRRRKLLDESGTACHDYRGGCAHAERGAHVE